MNWHGGVTKNQKCKQCGKIFDSDQSGRKFCCLRCRYDSQKVCEPIQLSRNRYVKPRTYHLTKRDKHGGILDIEWRNKIFKRDDYTCQICHVRGTRIQADHIKPYKEFPELRYELSNGRTLCIDCHKKTETYGWSKYWHNRKKSPNDEKHRSIYSHEK